MKRGFTLIELLVVITIVGMLAAIVMVSVNSTRVKARDMLRAGDVKQVAIALELYFDKFGYYPGYTVIGSHCNTGASFNSLQPLVTEGFLPVMIIDPVNKTTAPNRLCYAYGGLGTASDYSSLSAWYCAGRRRTDYKYFFLFSTEAADLNYNRLTDSTGTPNNEFKYCLFGPLK